MKNFIKAEFYKIKNKKSIWIWLIFVPLIILVLFLQMKGANSSNLKDLSVETNTYPYMLPWVLLLVGISPLFTIFVGFTVLSGEFREGGKVRQVEAGYSTNKTYLARYFLIILIGCLYILFLLLIFSLGNLLLGFNFRQVLVFFTTLFKIFTLGVFPLFALGAFIQMALYLSRSEIVTVFAWLFFTFFYKAIEGILNNLNINIFSKISQYFPTELIVDILAKVGINNFEIDSKTYIRVILVSLIWIILFNLIGMTFFKRRRFQ